MYAGVTTSPPSPSPLHLLFPSTFPPPIALPPALPFSSPSFLLYHSHSFPFSPLPSLSSLLLQYDTDFYMLDKYPLAIRPFYTMPDPNNPVTPPWVAPILHISHTSYIVWAAYVHLQYSSHLLCLKPFIIFMHDSSKTSSWGHIVIDEALLTCIRAPFMGCPQ